MDLKGLYEFIHSKELAVMASVHNSFPQAALIGIAVTKNLDLVFDTLKNSRKYLNLLKNPNIAFVIGWDDEKTVQYEGTASELQNKDDNLRKLYFSKFSKGKDRANQKDVTHFHVTPHM